MRVEKAIRKHLISFPALYNVALRRRVARRIDVLKLNRSWRGFRHGQGLPVRGQRTKTNARTVKVRRTRRRN